MSSETATMNEISTPANLVIKPAECTSLNFIVECDSQIVKVYPDNVIFENMVKNSFMSYKISSDKNPKVIIITSETLMRCFCSTQSQRYNEKATKISKSLLSHSSGTEPCASNFWITCDCVFTLSERLMTAQQFESFTIGLQSETSESKVETSEFKVETCLYS